MRYLTPMIIVTLILTSNALFIVPPPSTTDTAWLLQELQREEIPRDVKRVGLLEMTPTRASPGSIVQVTVAEGGSGHRALVMIDSQGEMLEVRFDPLQSQLFLIPEDALPGSFTFWLAGVSLELHTGIGVITLEVYRPMELAEEFTPEDEGNEEVESQDYGE